jgi:membrane protein DedA with SNARE-associated domain
MAWPEGKLLPNAVVTGWSTRGRWATKVLPPTRIQALHGVLERKGWGVIVTGRVAAFPSTLVGAAAGVSDMPASKFLSADGVGGALSTALSIGAGYALGRAYEDAGPWLTGLGVAMLLGLFFVVGRWLKGEGQRSEPTKAPS